MRTFTTAQSAKDFLSQNPKALTICVHPQTQRQSVCSTVREIDALFEGRPYNFTDEEAQYRVTLHQKLKGTAELHRQAGILKKPLIADFIKAQLLGELAQAVTSSAGMTINGELQAIRLKCDDANTFTEGLTLLNSFLLRLKF